MSFNEVEDENGVTHEVAKSPESPNNPPIFAGIPQLFPGGYANVEELVLAAAHEAGDWGTFHQDVHLDVDFLLQDLTMTDVLRWYLHDVRAIAFADKYIAEFWGDNPPPGPTEDVLRGGLFVALTDYLVETYDRLEREERLPWQQPECFYCGQQGLNLHHDRINQPTCRSCWDTSMDGPWKD